MGMPYRGEYNAEVMRKMQDAVNATIEGDYVVAEPRKVFNSEQAAIERFDVDGPDSFEGVDPIDPVGQITS